MVQVKLEYIYIYNVQITAVKNYEQKILRLPVS
jgi:hypothetical protein